MSITSKDNINKKDKLDICEVRADINWYCDLPWLK